MRGRWIVPLVLPLALVAACGGTTPVAAGPGGLLVAEGVSRKVPSAAEPVGPAVTGMTAFGYDLLRAMGEDAAGNVVVSPLSIAYAFGMAEAGARGETRRQIDETFGFGEDGPHEAFNALTRQIGATDTAPPVVPKSTPPMDQPQEPHPPILAIANGLFVQQDFPVEQDFLRILAEQYGAGARTVDFYDDPDAAAKVINDWVRQQTANRIDKLFDQLETDTKLVLANAVYLKADWARGFQRSQTVEQPFHLAGGRNVMAPLMRQNDDLLYAKGDGWQAVELPYADRKLAMWVLVPTGTGDPLDLLSPATMDTVGKSLAPATVDLSLPRWDFGKKVDLIPPLQELGMTVPFTDRADFHGMTDADLLIGQAIHRANITVDEDGTEAAAVTGIAMVPTSAGPVLPHATIRADHPFAFAIVHKPTHTPLFIGQVADPTQG